MTVPEDERHPPGQEEAPRGESGGPTRSIVGHDEPTLNRPPATRPASYIAPSAASIPPELKATPHWVAWRYEQRIDKKTGELKPTKVPVNPRTGRNASSTDPRTWGTFEQAWSRYERDALDGVGFVVTQDAGIVGIDVDHCRDPETGVIDDEALAIVREVDSYTEMSPSGTGIRIFARGTLPNGWRKRGRVEMYDRARYLTVTGVQVEFQ